MDAEARATVSDLFADPEPSDELVRLVGESVREAGGLDHAREQATRFARSARSRLDIIPEDPFVRILRLTVDFVLERQK